jgi:hypothetical protein
MKYLVRVLLRTLMYELIAWRRLVLKRRQVLDEMKQEREASWREQRRKADRDRRWKAGEQVTLAEMDEIEAEMRKGWDRRNASKRGTRAAR